MFDEESSEPLTNSDTNNATKFHPDDATYESRTRLDGTATFEQHYTRLRSHNDGIYTGKWADKAQLRDQDNNAVFDAIAGQLELSPFQKAIGRTEFGTLNLRDLSSPAGIDTPLVAIMVAAVVARRDGRGYHPARSPASNDDLFTALLSELGYTNGLVHSAFGKVQYRLDCSQ
ncbi:hypothetical protein [Halonotius roseus]|uniref:Uncharacterized protein n=1 Tax=Halonotius roseus TaxID=2511997 RepID=A0A544QR26_9EURY|nr:hypothetical protein [Halonotius roseus]TQQ81888.1 hypothetical protein EWF95_02820 [Halonotius roseus]